MQSSVFLIRAILVDTRHLIVVSICIFLVANDVDHLFMLLLAIYISAWRNIYSDPLDFFSSNCGMGKTFPGIAQSQKC